MSDDEEVAFDVPRGTCFIQSLVHTHQLPPFFLGHPVSLKRDFISTNSFLYKKNNNINNDSFNRNTVQQQQKQRPLLPVDASEEVSASLKEFPVSV